MFQGLEGGTYSNLSSGQFSIRFSPKGTLSESKGAMLYTEQLSYVLAFMNSSVAGTALQFLCPTLDFKSGPLKTLPLIGSSLDENAIKEITSNCINLAKLDWDSLETSWDFKRSPLL